MRYELADPFVELKPSAGEFVFSRYTLIVLPTINTPLSSSVAWGRNVCSSLKFIIAWTDVTEPA